MELSGKIALVTGASTGIGRAAAKLLHARGVKVALLARSQDKLQALANELSGSFVITADLEKDGEAKRGVEETAVHFGGIDILINNAGRGYSARLESIDLPTLRSLYELNVFSQVAAMQAAVPHMRKRGCGSIVNIDSGTALMAIPGLSAYSSSKRALVGVSLTAREELAADNISVSLVYPFLTDTDFSKNSMGKTPQRPDSREDLPSGDSAEYVAELIVKAIETGAAEILAHDWMGRASNV